MNRSYSIGRTARSAFLIMMVLLALAGASWADPLQGRAQVLEHTCRALLLKMNPNYQFEKPEGAGEDEQVPASNPAPAAAVPVVAPPLSWGQKLALDDVERLYKASQELQRMIEEGEDDYNTLFSKVAQVQSAANQVKLTLPISNLDEEGRKVGEGLVISAKEMAEATSKLRQAQEEERRLAQQYRASYGGWGYSPWSLNLGWTFGRPWGYSRGWGGWGGYRGYRGSRGWCR